MVVMVAITRSPLGTKSRAHSFDRLFEKQTDEDKEMKTLKIVIAHTRDYDECP